jgi:hypothetical protein
MDEKRKIPFEFVFDYLPTDRIEVKSMFGMFSVYQGEKLMLILRNRPDHPETNGIWVPIQLIFLKGLKSEIPSLSRVHTWAGKKEDSDWLLIPSGSDDFEISAINICRLISRNDPRIGKISVRRKKNK